MAIFRRRGPAASSEDLAKAVAAELAKMPAFAGSLPPGTNTTDVGQLVAALAGTMPKSGGMRGFFENLPRTDPNVPFGAGVPIGPAPIDPLDANGRTHPRTLAYPISWNLQLGQTRLTPFTLLRDAADVDLVRRCIEIRKADIVALEWDITLSDSVVQQVMDDTGERNRARATQVGRQKYEGLIEALKQFWTKPDRMNGLSFSEFVNSLMEEMLVTDAVCIYPHPSLGAPPVPGLQSNVHSLRLIDGSTIKPLYDHLGNLPGNGQPAYQQVLYGFPRGEYSYDPEARGDLISDQLMYRPKNRRITSPYGKPPVEQALPLIDLWLKREEWIRAEYSVGANPNTWIETTLVEGDTPWTPEQRRTWEQALNGDLSGQTAERMLIHLLPPGMKPAQMSEFAEKYQVDYDQFLALRLATFFDVMSTAINITPKGGLGGKGHQEGEDAKTEAQARRPTVAYLTDLFNDCNEQFLGVPPGILTFVFRSTDEDDVAELTLSRQQELFSAQKTLNDILGEAGAPLLDFAEADMPFIVAPGLGLTFLEGASTRPTPPIAPFPGAPIPPGGPGLPAPGADPAQVPPDKDPDVKPAPGPVEKAAEIARYVRFVAKGPRTRDFVWAHHDADEIKAVMATLPKAATRVLPGDDRLDAIVEHYAPLIAEQLGGGLEADTIAQQWLDANAGIVKAPNPSSATAEAQAAPYAASAGAEMDTAVLAELLTQLYQDAYTAGSGVAADQVAALLGGPAQVAGSAGTVATTIDWSQWKPGHPDAAALASDGGLNDLLDGSGVEIQGMNETTVASLGDALSTALQAGMNVDETSALISSTLANPGRARMIAITETRRAMTSATLASYRANDVPGDAWLAEPDACPLCLANEAAGVLPIDDPFPSGDLGPPGHPSCRCVLTPSMTLPEAA